MLGWVTAVGGSGTVHVEDLYDTDIDDLWASVDRSGPDRGLARCRRG